MSHCRGLGAVLVAFTLLIFGESYFATRQACAQSYIWEIPGAGPENLLHPTGVAVDFVNSELTLLAADADHHRIVRIRANGSVSTVAGTGISGYNGDQILATEAQLTRPEGVALTDNNEILIADSGNSRIRKISADGTITTIAGVGQAGFNGDDIPATKASLSVPTGVAATSVGDIIIADYGNNRVRKVTAAGIIKTVAGTGHQGYNGDDIPGGKAELTLPTGVALTPTQEIVIADYGNNLIRKVDHDGTITTVAGNGLSGNARDGAIATNTSVNKPEGVAVSANGEILFADTYNSCLRKISPKGRITTVAGNGKEGFGGDNVPARTAPLYWPEAVTTIGGAVIVADTGNSRLRFIGPPGKDHLLAAEIRSAATTMSDNVRLSVVKHLDDTAHLAVEKYLTRYSNLHSRLGQLPRELLEEVHHHDGVTTQRFATLAFRAQLALHALNALPRRPSRGNKFGG